MAQVIKTTFQLRRGNLEVWERNNPILAKGEPSFVIDKNALKIGDGVTPWKDLEYIGVNQEDLAKAIEDYFKDNPGTGGAGSDGRGIISIIRTKGNGEPGSVDVYTITYTDLTTSTFTVYNGKDGQPGTNGRGITAIMPPEGGGIPGLYDVYTINYTDGTTSTFKVYNGKDGIGKDGFSPTAIIRESPGGVVIELTDKNGTTQASVKHGDEGRGIVSIEKIGGDGDPGTHDTYQINYSDGTNSTFQVYNGKDGSSADYEQRAPQIFQASSFESLPTTNVYIGDFGIVKVQFGNNNQSHTAYIYTENGWAAMDGNYSADNVYFDEDLLVTTKIGTIQTLTNGQATLSAKGKTLKQVFSSLIAERKNPSATLPSGAVELTNYENGNYLVEVGETITPTWKTTFSAGSYTYGPATGVTSTQAKVYLSTNSNSSSIISAGEMNGKTGSLSALTIEDSTTKHYAKVDYGWTQGTSVPKDNFGDDYTNASKNLPIQAASNKVDISTYYIQGYRKAFFGSRVSPIELNSYNIRSLADNTNSFNSSFTIAIDQGATQVIIATPQGRIVKKVEDNGAFGQDILEAFDKYTGNSGINVGGADATSSDIGNYSVKYNVYVYNPSTPLGSNTYTVILDNE